MGAAVSAASSGAKATPLCDSAISRCGFIVELAPAEALFGGFAALMSAMRRARASAAAEAIVPPPGRGLMPRPMLRPRWAGCEAGSANEESTRPAAK